MTFAVIFRLSPFEVLSPSLLQSGVKVFATFHAAFLPLLAIGIVCRFVVLALENNVENTTTTRPSGTTAIQEQLEESTLTTATAAVTDAHMPVKRYNLPFTAIWLRFGKYHLP